MPIIYDEVIAQYGAVTKTGRLEVFCIGDALSSMIFLLHAKSDGLYRGRCRHRVVNDIINCSNAHSI